MGVRICNSCICHEGTRGLTVAVEDLMSITRHAQVFPGIANLEHHPFSDLSTELPVTLVKYQRLAASS